MKQVLGTILLGLCGLLLAGPAAAQLQVYPCEQHMDSVVLKRTDVEFRVLFPSFQSPGGWGKALAEVLREGAQARAKAIVKLAAETDPVDPTAGGPLCIEEGRVSLVWGTPELVVLRDSYYSYSAGMAHGDQSTHFRVLGWYRGRLKPVSLKELLVWNPDLQAELNRQILGQLTLLGASAVIEGQWKSLDSRRLQDAAPTAPGLFYVMNAYEAGSHAEGEFELLIPWRALAAWIPAQGALSRQVPE